MSLIATSRFRYGHATGSDWTQAVERVIDQLDEQAADERYASTATLGIAYWTEGFANAAEAVIERLKTATGLRHWVGATAGSVFGGRQEYVQPHVRQGALAVLLLDLPGAALRTFSGTHPLPALPHGTGAPAPDTPALALVHADPRTPDVDVLITELAQRTRSHFLFGGLSSGLPSAPQLAEHFVYAGLSGVAFADAAAGGADIRVKVTQGCHPVTATPGRPAPRPHTVTQADANWLLQLNGEPAFDVLLRDVGLGAYAGRMPPGEMLREKLAGGLFVGMAVASVNEGAATVGMANMSPGAVGDYVVRGVIGIDPRRRAVALADEVQQGDRLHFCRRNREAARADLVRCLTELREELEEAGKTPRGALYISCNGRGVHLFDEPGVELGLIAHHLKDLPVIGFAANGEIARDRLYGFTGVLAVFS
ncbi:MAG TPA: FIST C-terminal domain-containing protein [Burkholderiaceae bacterium]|nr:FIST C-terminal domain-containing protein [Burkholderiaceae bacterium]